MSKITAIIVDDEANARNTLLASCEPVQVVELCSGYRTLFRFTASSKIDYKAQA